MILLPTQQLNNSDSTCIVSNVENIYIYINILKIKFYEKKITFPCFREYKLIVETTLWGDSLENIIKYILISKENY